MTEMTAEQQIRLSCLSIATDERHTPDDNVRAAEKYATFVIGQTRGIAAPDGYLVMKGPLGWFFGAPTDAPGDVDDRSTWATEAGAIAAATCHAEARAQ